MAASWRALSKASGFTVSESDIDVRFHDERAHRVSVEERDDCYLLTAIVLGRAAIEHSGVSPVRFWEMNRSLNLVGFRIDGKGRLVGEAWVPKTGISPHEFQFVVRNLAIESDRYEYMLTGRDLE